LTIFEYLYDCSSLDQMKGLIERASDKRTVSRTELNDALIELFDSILDQLDGEWALVNQLTEEEELSNTELATLFSEAADAPDPMVIIAKDRFALTQVKRRAVNHIDSPKYRNLHLRPDFVELPFEAMSEAEQMVLREHIIHLKTYYRSNVRHGRSENASLNIALIGLGEIFVSVADLNLHEFELPHSPESRFIKFAVLATSPWFDANLCTNGALSKRWSRLKDQHFQ
jgi:hypothetical protein